MNLLTTSQVSGDLFVLARTNPTHFVSRQDVGALVSGVRPQNELVSSRNEDLFADLQPATSFKDRLFDNLQQVNQAQQEHEALSIQAIVNPDSVDAHDVSVASAKARMLLDITRNITDRVLQAYQTIINIR